MVSLKRPKTSSRGGKVFWRKATTMESSVGVSTVLFGVFGTILVSVIVVRFRHLPTVLMFRVSVLIKRVLASKDALP
jgi:hypothetical protein